MRATLPLIALLLVSGCVAPPKAPPAPRPVAVPPAPTSVALPPPSNDWRDWPALPGSWTYAPSTRAATFGVAGQPIAARIGCKAGQVVLTLLGALPGALTVRTSSTTRAIALAASPAGEIQARLAATDPLLDAIAFSRGRFVLEQAARRWVLPAYAEVGRVIEDCR
ncbi:hypothetical protein GGQ80_003131 [Sphingomonas jinjuensis]|uniref:Lipoprotein n=1 Tax=Sphingomonas jinjuensis TaxID=535907 RepID=A0A840F7H7_9SPHN|nr:hypothetical protein [Sphingomonas jinjuensis]MBB4155213.1 hypothetical protein [Sphingomonas jinjuensis]